MIQKRTELDRYIIHWLSPCNTKNKHQDPKTNQNKNTNKQTTQTRHKNKKQHGRWSVLGQLEIARRDDNIVISPQGLVWQCKTKAKQQTTKCHTTICEPGSNKCTMRKPRLPPARSLEITECKPHGQHSHRFMDTIQKPARRCLVASGKTLKSDTWCESGETTKKLTALRGHSESSQVCFVYHQP